MQLNYFDKAPSPRAHLGHHGFCVSLQTDSRRTWSTCPRCHPHPQHRWWRRRHHRPRAYRLWLYNPGGPAAHCASWGPRTATPSSALWIWSRNATPSSARWIRLSRAPQRPQTRTVSTSARAVAAAHRYSRVVDQGYDGPGNHHRHSLSCARRHLALHLLLHLPEWSKTGPRHRTLLWSPVAALCRLSRQRHRRQLEARSESLPPSGRRIPSGPVPQRTEAARIPSR